MAKICVIGGSGFVGTHLIHLLKESHNITIVDKKLSKIYPDLTVLCDIRNAAELRELLLGYDVVIHLAAEHKDDISPLSLYYEVNVQGTQNILDSMDVCNISNIIFTSSVAIYGLNKSNPDEEYAPDPFNHYGKSKWQAEELIRNWAIQNSYRSAMILRPTVIFGENNRGNVYQLLKHISSGRFLRVGKGNNYKSMAYVGNVVTFIDYKLKQLIPGLHVYNYVDKPDMTINELIKAVECSMGFNVSSFKIPYWAGMLAGYCFDILSWLAGRKLSISSIRVRKYCSTTQFDSLKAHNSGFKPLYSLSEGINRTIHFEFIEKKTDDLVFESE